MMRSALVIAFSTLSTMAWAQCANVNGRVCVSAESATLRGEATVVRTGGAERVSGVVVVAPGQRIVVADKAASLSLGASCKVTVPAFSSVSLSASEGTLCANGIRPQVLNSNVTVPAKPEGLERFQAAVGANPPPVPAPPRQSLNDFQAEVQACPQNQIRQQNGLCACPTGLMLDPTSRACVPPTFDYLIGGGIIGAGIIGAVVIANSGDKTVSP